MLLLGALSIMLKHCCECFTPKKHKEHGQDANKAQGKAKCFISIEAAQSALHHIKHYSKVAV